MENSEAHLTTRIRLTRELAHLKKCILASGEEARQSLALTISAYTVSSEFILLKVQEIDLKVQEQVIDIEKLCFATLSLQQPLLKDLRLVVGTLRLCSHLLRITNCAKRLTTIAELFEDKSCIPPELLTITENCQLMLVDALQAFHNNSIPLALNIIKKDQDLDALHGTAFQKIIQRMSQKDQDKTLVSLDAQLLTAVRLVERLGDTITEIAKEIYFVQSGEKFHH